MKKICWFSSDLGLAFVASLQAQNSFIDTVTITAPDPDASETGPDPGRFEIRRTGPTNFGLVVFYRISGTASNGVDYEQIPNAISIPQGSLSVSIPIKPIDDALAEGNETVVLQIVPSPLECPSPACGYDIGSPSNATVPAGHRAARIVVVPIDDNIVERIESVLLSLQTPTDSPPAYVVGYPSRAAAIILDNDQPRPPCGKLSDGLFHLCVPGTNGYAFCVRASSDLGHWTSLCTNVVTEG